MSVDRSTSFPGDIPAWASSRADPRLSKNHSDVQACYVLSPRSAYNQIDLMQIATSPPAPFMRLYHARYPWYVDVYASNPNGVTIYDILMQLHVQMMMAIESRHYYCQDARSKERKLLGAAYTSGCHGDKEIMTRGVVRVDFLGMEGRLLLQGLVRGRNGMWEMKIAKIDS
ncbi:hypothetical protein ARMSODRAFT_973760 [Armillaria solidipes]|uniref:DUF6699 domain-containing protein n=1 Tax=Armillaria solidipes TaxID=1076256 RepID=A0A2H3BKD1_9AGAR|nr:hypothetical protein ARMSODRAFT_973760 [Armillaria solidipes]